MAFSNLNLYFNPSRNPRKKKSCVPLVFLESRGEFRGQEFLFPLRFENEAGRGQHKADKCAIFADRDHRSK